MNKYRQIYLYQTDLQEQMSEFIRIKNLNIKKKKKIVTYSYKEITQQRQQLSNDGEYPGPLMSWLLFYCSRNIDCGLPVNQAAAVESVLPAQPVVEVNPSSLQSNCCLVPCALHTRTEATVEDRIRVREKKSLFS